MEQPELLYQINEYSCDVFSLLFFLCLSWPLKRAGRGFYRIWLNMFHSRSISIRFFFLSLLSAHTKDVNEGGNGNTERWFDRMFLQMKKIR